MVWFFDPWIDERHPAFVRGTLRYVRHKNSLHRFDRGGLTIARPVSLPNGRIPLREPPCPGRQVGEGVSPTLDAQPLFKRSKVVFPQMSRALAMSILLGELDLFCLMGGDGAI